MFDDNDNRTLYVQYGSLKTSSFTLKNIVAKDFYIFEITTNMAGKA